MVGQPRLVVAGSLQVSGKAVANGEDSAQRAGMSALVAVVGQSYGSFTAPSVQPACLHRRIARRRQPLVQRRGVGSVHFVNEHAWLGLGLGFGFGFGLGLGLRLGFGRRV